MRSLGNTGLEAILKAYLVYAYGGQKFSVAKFNPVIRECKLSLGQKFNIAFNPHLLNLYFPIFLGRVNDLHTWQFPAG